MLLPSNSSDSALSEQVLCSKTLSCAFSLTLKHSDPKVAITLRATRLCELVSLSDIGWPSDSGLVPM